MRIYKMTATFGKLEHAVLELKPGLNIITAPNEWGKSTWCAFLTAMMYGLDTRAKTTKNALADKERYAPWSGSPMAGRIDLHWEGRYITIERRTRGRIPLGEFKAYETASGLPVTELTAANCGELLLGVEQSVFRRAGFIRHADLPVTQDEALRRRLNALVTTGDDSGAADRLAEQLRDLKNRCRYNRSGLLPQAEAERDALEEKLTEMDSLEVQIQSLNHQLGEVRNWLAQLKNHQQTLAYRKMQEDLSRVEESKVLLLQIQQELQQLENACSQLPPLDEAEQMVRELRAFREQWNILQSQADSLPEEPRQPQLPAPFEGLSAETAREMVLKDGKRYADNSGGKAATLLILVGFLGLLSGGALTFLKAYLFAGIAGVAGMVALIWGVCEKIAMKKRRRELLEKYGHNNWKHWGDSILVYEREMAVYRNKRKDFQGIRTKLEAGLKALNQKREMLCGYEDPETVLDFWEDTRDRWTRCYAARREEERARGSYVTLQSMVRPVDAPSQPDELTQSEEETARLIGECVTEQQRLQNRLGQYQGRMDLLGSRENARNQLDKVRDRIRRLEDTYAALVIAQETLTAARAELQRRFAPRITRRAQQLLAGMTAGRYHSVTMGEDFSLRAAAEQEETLHDALWRSDGTVDQLYLALRLAVAEELTPNVPLILDDVLVRFDDQRMRRAVAILRDLAQKRQVVLFTCQGRENEA